MSKLNKRQKKYCELVATGITHTDAYIQAGFSSKGASRSASRLLKKAPVCDYLLEIAKTTKDLAKEQAINTRLDNLQILSKIAQHTSEKTNDRISAIKEINLMQNFNTQIEKSEVALSHAVSDEEMAEREKLFKEKLGFSNEKILESSTYNNPTIGEIK